MSDLAIRLRELADRVEAGVEATPEEIRAFANAVTRDAQGARMSERAAVEAGFRACERGRNLQLTLKNLFGMSEIAP